MRLIAVIWIGFGIVTGSVCNALAADSKADQSDKLTHWQAAEILHDGDWLTIAAYEKRMQSDERLSKYRELRDAVRDGHQPEINLAGWCGRQGLADAEALHLRRVALNPKSASADRQRAMKRLGVKLHKGKLRTADEIRGIEQRAASLRKNAANWTPVVRKWRIALESAKPRKQAYALQHLRELKDASAIPTIEKFLSPANEFIAGEVVAFLSRMPDAESTESLVRHAVDAPWQSVRVAAVSELKKRATHDYVPLLMKNLKSPLQSRFQVGIGPDGMVRRAHQVYQAGQNANRLQTDVTARSPRGVNEVVVQRRGSQQVVAPLNQVLLQNDIRRFRLNSPTVEQDWEDIQERLDYERMLSQMRQMIAFQEVAKGKRIEQSVAAINKRLEKRNTHVISALKETTDEDLNTASEWWDWWQEYNDVYQTEKPTYARTSGRADPQRSIVQVRPPCECFAAGTVVWTETGLVPIEEIILGDRVLSQDVDTGELAYKIVTGKTLRPPHELHDVHLTGETITTTAGHPFWVNNVGWRMTKRLKAGHQLASAGDQLPVTEVVPSSKKQAAHNLVVEDFSTYFVGKRGVLVHDNTARRPTTALSPGSHRADSAVANASSRSDR